MFKAQYFNDHGWNEHEDIYFKDPISISLNCSVVESPGKYNILVVIEPESIIDTSNFRQNYFKDFDLILTWRKDIIDKFDNAKFFPFGTGWVDEKNLTYNKKDMVSYLTSNKFQSDGHKIRHNVFTLMSNIEDINGMKYTQIMTPPRIEKKEAVLDEYKFSIIVENEKDYNWFTEKIIDCFISKTIPIYWGCPNIGDFFDTDGIITFDDPKDLLYKLTNIIKSGEYEKRINAVEKNYILCQKYRDFYENLKIAISKNIYGEE